MKKIIFALLMMLEICFLSSLLIAGNDEPQKAIEKVAHEFAESINQQDAVRFAAVFNSEAKFFVLTPQGFQTNPPEKWVEALKAKKIGGREREIKLTGTDLTAGNVASVKVETVDTAISFIFYLTLVKLEENWRIVSVTAGVEQLKQ